MNCKPVLVFDLDGTLWDTIHDGKIYKIRLFNGVRELLEEYSKEYILAVASFRRDGEKLLNELGLRSYFKSVVCGRFCSMSKYFHLSKISEELHISINNLILFDNCRIIISNSRFNHIPCIEVNNGLSKIDILCGLRDYIIQVYA